MSRHKRRAACRDATRQLLAMAALCIVFGAPVAGAPFASAQSFVARHSSLERRAARLEVSTSASERAEIAGWMARHGPAAAVAEHLARALTVELDPAVQQALLLAACRVLVREPDAARPALEPVLLERYAAATPSERAPWARALGASASPAAVEALLARVTDPSGADALVAARASDAVLPALRLAPSEALVQLAERIGDAQALPVLIGLLRPGATVEVPAIRAIGALAARGTPEERALATEAIVAQARATNDAWLLAALFDAIATIGPPVDGAAAVLSPRLEDPEPTVRLAALRALALVDPVAARPTLLLAIERDEDRPMVRDVLARSDAPALVEVAERMAAIEAERMAAIDALARARDGSGIDALARLGAPPIALALAAARAATPPAVEIEEPVARAVAGLAVDRADGEAGAQVRLRLAMAAAASERAPDLGAALRDETDPRVRAWLLEAARRHQTPLDGPWLEDALHHALRARDGEIDVAGLLSVVPWAVTSPAGARRLHALVSSSLRSSSPLVRAAAAMTAAERGDARSSAAIEALLEDRQAAVRIAAGIALVRLSPERAPFVAARARIDPDPRVARLLGDAASGRAVAPGEVLVVETEVHGELETGAVWLEVQSDDGLLRVLPAAEGGPFVLRDVPGATAEVRLRIR